MYLNMLKQTLMVFHTNTLSLVLNYWPVVSCVLSLLTRLYNTYVVRIYTYILKWQVLVTILGKVLCKEDGIRHPKNICLYLIGKSNNRGGLVIYLRKRTQPKRNVPKSCLMFSALSPNQAARISPVKLWIWAEWLLCLHTDGIPRCIEEVWQK